MSLPWKTKVKNTRISQLVNDHLHKSQKRRDGSSLVVETGFPTSLVDLFIKNREKLKKPSKKKRQNPPITTLIDGDNDPLIMGSTPSSFRPIPPSHSPLITVLPQRSPSVPTSLPSEGIKGTNVNQRSSDGRDREEADTGVDANKVLLVVLKMFFVVVLALGTKRLTVGITISAFLLFFLEFVGKHAPAVLKPCSEAKGVSRSMVHRVLRLLRFKEVNLDGVSMLKTEQDHSVKRGCSLKYYTCHDQEIQVVESNMVDEIQPEDEIIEGYSYKSNLGYQEIESKPSTREEEVSELKKKSRKAKIKSKMKKFVAKKLRCSRKEHDSQRGVEMVKEDNIILQCEDEKVWDNASELSSSISSGRYKEDDNMSALSDFVRVSDVSEKTFTKREGKRDGLNWKYLLLCVIVLAGLISGRAFAVVLTLSWFMLLKLGENYYQGK